MHISLLLVVGHSLSRNTSREQVNMHVLPFYVGRQARVQVIAGMDNDTITAWNMGKQPGESSAHSPLSLDAWLS